MWFWEMSSYFNTNCFRLVKNLFCLVEISDSTLKSLFKASERAFKDFERTFKGSERTFKGSERNFYS